jgi:hypothetical protein
MRGNIPCIILEEIENRICKYTIPDSKLEIYRIPKESLIKGYLPENISKLPVVYIARNNTSLYIGQADICEGRLKNPNSHHILNKEDFSWNEVIIFSSSEFSKDIIGFLEGELIKYSKKSTYKLLNSQSSGANIIDAIRLTLVKQYLNKILWIDDFYMKTKCFFSAEEKIKEIKEVKEIIKKESSLYDEIKVKAEILRNNVKIKIDSIIFKMEDGSVVLKEGSKVADIETASLNNIVYKKTRDFHMENDDIDKNTYKTTKNITFSSMSKALSVIFANPTSESSGKKYLTYM